MARHGWGIYLPNDGDVRVGDALEIAGAGCYTILHHQAGKDQAVKKIREAQPEALIQVRCYCPNWFALAPADWARECHRIMHEGADPIARHTRHLTWANEQNLAAESGGRIGAAFGRLATWRDYEVIALWNEAFVAAYRALPDAEGDVLHYPGMAYGHGEDWGYDGDHNPLPGFPVVDGVPTPAYELLRAGIDRCPILNHHPYVQRGAPVLDEWVGVRRIEKTIALFPGKAIYAAETGQFDVTDPRAPDQLVEIGYYLQGRAEVIGWTPFILDSPDPGHAMNNWARNPRIAEAYSRTTRLPKPQEPPVSDIDLSVPTRVSMASPDNYQTGPRRTTVGVVIHTTRGGGRPATEFSSTIAWFSNPDAGVSAHLVVGHTPFDEVARCVHDDDVAWHAREANATHLGIEICQAKPTDPITDFQYRAAAEACRKWAAKYKFPIRRVFSIHDAGLIGHEDTEPGKRDGKSDPGPAFDWNKFVKLAGGGAVPDTAEQLRSKVYALGEQIAKTAADWKAAGHPQHAEYVESAGYAVMKTMTIGKGEK